MAHGKNVELQGRPYVGYSRLANVQFMSVSARRKHHHAARRLNGNFDHWDARAGQLADSAINIEFASIASGA